LRGADLVIAFTIGAGAIILFVLLLFADVESLRRMDIADTRWDRSGRFRGGRRSPRPKHKQK
jgi:FtsH-binding integral membrane protein